MNIFIDTGPLRALVMPRDQWRTKTLSLFHKLSPENNRIITTDYILDEVFTGLLGVQGGYMRIKEFDSVLKQKVLSVEWITQARFLETKRLFLKIAKDKQWSFTDCTSFVVMKELKIKTVFTFDQHFEQMGFDLLA